MLLLLPPVLGSRQIRGSGKTPGIQGNDYPFPVSCERPKREFRLNMGGTLNSWRSDMGFIGWADPGNPPLPRKLRGGRQDRGLGGRKASGSDGHGAQPQLSQEALQASL